MPGRLKVKILAGKHLPVMDRASESTDAFVEVKFGSNVYKTDVCSKSLNPLWNSEWFKFEVNDELLQDEPLQVRVLDHDTYSAHDAIGKVYIDVDPLLNPDSSHLLGGWFPIYDTMHGIRGELLLVVKLELFADVNQFKQTSCGFKFVCGTKLPSCYQLQVVHGFVADLLICEDPEYKWIEKLRTPRSSNEARQRLFMKMSGELQRRIGSKVEFVGGNAVIGYQQSYDIEGDSGIVIRGIGTAVTLKAEDKHRLQRSTLLTESVKRSLSAPYTSSENAFLNQSHIVIKGKSNNEALTRFTDFPFYTLTTFPVGMVTRISAVVCSRSVKLLEKVHNQEDWETRESWWQELRQEISSHCTALSCNAVAGYREEASICDDVIVLSAEGTAVEIQVDLFESSHQGLKKKNFDSVSITFEDDDDDEESSNQGFSSEAALFRAVVNSGDYPSAVEYQLSPIDGKTPVPNILLCTIDVPNNVDYIGKGTLVQARFCRKLKKSQSESFALQASELLPFIEYELHRRICIKLKMRGMNAVFGYHSKVTIGENLIVGVITGTGVRISALPHDNELAKHHLSDINSDLLKFHEKSLENFDLRKTTTPLRSQPSEFAPSHDTKQDDKRSLFVELSESGKSDSWMLEESLPPPSCFCSNLDQCPGVKGFHEQSFFALRRIRYDDDVEDDVINRDLSVVFTQAINSVWFRMRRRIKSCFLSSLKFNLSLPDDDELQIWISGSVLVKNDHKILKEPLKRISAPYGIDFSPSIRKQFSLNLSSSDPEFDSPNASFEEQKLSRSLVRTRLSPFLSRIMRDPAPLSVRSRFNSTSSGKMRHQSESSSVSDFDFQDFSRLSPPVVIATTSNVPGRRTKRHIGVLSLFIVRETSAVKGAEEMIPMAEPDCGSGSNWFVMRTLAEAQALSRSHVAALGGNALTSCRTSYVVLKESLTKNEAQCLFHVIGDVIETS